MQNSEGNPKSRRSVHQLEAERPDRMEEACGVFAVQASEQPVANLAYFGLYALQHRGQESAGIGCLVISPLAITVIPQLAAAGSAMPSRWF
jgi:glutamate synthase domain-containing protein 1